MKQYEKAQVTMLPHSSPNTTITKYLPNTLSINNDILAPHTNQHLYITSADKIEDGDWVLMFDDFGNLFLCAEPQQYLIAAGHHLNKGLRKITATTDSSLKRIVGIGTFAPLPQPSQQFVEQYIESYNKGEIIDEVLVEYDCKTIQPYPRSGRDCGGNEIYEYIENLVISQDNTINITIKPIKDSWNREEVIANMKKALTKGMELEYSCDIDFDIDNWIKDNL